MNWKSLFFLVFILPITGIVFWLFVMNTFPEKLNTETPKKNSVEEMRVNSPFISFVDPSKGPEDARVTIVEYGDYGCFFCKNAEENIARFLSEHPDIRFVWKGISSKLHVGSDVAAEASYCARDQGKFWQYHDRLFKQSNIFNQTSLALIANDVGLDLDRFSACLGGGKKRHLVERNVTEAEALGVDATPYFFINDKRYSGQLSYEQLTEIVSSL